MSSVILIRHAMPRVVQGTSSKFWGLSESSREDCVLLAHALPAAVDGVWSSDERKAKETAEVLALRLGQQIQVDPRFQEVDRPQVWDRDFRELAASHLSGAPEPGWEKPESVVARFSAAIAQACSVSNGDVVVVSHGMAMSLWVASVAAIDIVPWWHDLTFPDAWRVDTELNTVERLWMGGVREE